MTLRSYVPCTPRCWIVEQVTKVGFWLLDWCCLTAEGPASFLWQHSMGNGIKASSSDIQTLEPSYLTSHEGKTEFKNSFSSGSAASGHLLFALHDFASYLSNVSCFWHAGEIWCQECYSTWYFFKLPASWWRSLLVVVFNSEATTVHIIKHGLQNNSSAWVGPKSETISLTQQHIQETFAHLGEKIKTYVYHAHSFMALGCARQNRKQFHSPGLGDLPVYL